MLCISPMLQLCSIYFSAHFHLFVPLHIRLPHGAGFTATFLLHAKSDTFEALSLSRIVDAEVCLHVSSPSLTFDL